MSLSKKIKQVALVATLAFSVNAAAPKPAQAILGIAHGNVAMIVTGSILAAGGITMMGVGFCCHSNNGGHLAGVGNAIGAYFLGAPGAVFTLAGLLLLDGPSGPRIGYTELTEAQKTLMNISSEEYEVYESQLEEIAALTDTGTAKAVAAGVRSEQEAKAHFEPEYSTLEPETQSVMKKIIRANLKAANPQEDATMGA